MKRTPVANKTELLILLKENSAQLRDYGIRKLCLFGSFVRDADIHKKSDVDFIVDIYEDKIDWIRFHDLGEFLENLLGRKVELIMPGCMSPFILPHVLKELEDVKLEEVVAY